MNLARRVERVEAARELRGRGAELLFVDAFERRLDGRPHLVLGEIELGISSSVVVSGARDGTLLDGFESSRT